MKTIICLILVFSSLNAFASKWSERRANLDVETALHIGVDYRMPLSQVSVGAFLNDESLIGAKLGSGQADDDETQTNVSLFYKNFVASTFYISPEIFYINFEDKHTWDENQDVIAYGVHFRIGNQWQWKHFSIGCDWFGIGKMMAFERNEGDNDDGDTLTLTITNFYVAYSF